MLTEHPQRLSTDIDIIVEPGTDVERYVMEAAKIFPFKSHEKQVRQGKNKIEKVHYKFIYASPLLKKDFYILLDIVFMENPYTTIIEREISNDILLIDGTPSKVVMPSADCILGDKLTAFAPHTTGIPLGVDKELEIMKQLYDVRTLSEQLHVLLVEGIRMLKNILFMWMVPTHWMAMFYEENIMAMKIENPENYIAENISKSQYRKLSYIKSISWRLMGIW